MPELLTAAQMRRLESAAIASGTVTGLELMERAGRGVVEAVFARWPHLAAAPHRALVLCGPGNNGGDGFVIARLLHGWGWTVDLHACGDPDRLPPDAAENARRWLALGAVKSLTHAQVAEAARAGVTLVVDAVFGTGLTRPVTGVLAEALTAVNDTLRDGGGPTPPVVAVDAPSGLCLDSGRTLGGEGNRNPPLPADLTVTFHAAKRGHYLAEGPAACGRLAIADIGLRRRSEAAPDDSVLLLGPPDPSTLRKSDPDGHKYRYGHVLVLSGGVGRGGAARLAARGALRVGAGAVTLGCPPAAVMENAAQLDAVMLRPVADADALAEVLEDDRLNALCLGPGLGLDDRAVGLVASALDRPRAAVLDADALTLLSRNPDLCASLHGRCVLTPHAGEFKRLFPEIAGQLEAPPVAGPAFSRIDAARAAAACAGCVVLLKGPDTVIADPAGRCAVHAGVYERAAPWLATAGAGDVLAGFIAGLLARGLAPMQAAETAAWLHVECARAFGPGLIAEDLPEALPGVLRGLSV